MKHLGDAKTLVAHARQELVRIELAYGESLSDKSVRPALLVEIKNLMENLRSALDYVAVALFTKCGQSNRADPKIYFPYATEGQTLLEFRNANRIDLSIPGLSNKRPDIVAKLESYQAFADPKNAWLPRFMDLNNENKHQQLDPQVRKEAKELKISSGGAAISLGEGASISMGPGSSIRLGDGLVIPGGQTFDANRPPVTIGPGKTEVITWVSFNFASNSEPVLPFLGTAVDGVERIVNELASL